MYPLPQGTGCEGRSRHPDGEARHALPGHSERYKGEGMLIIATMIYLTVNFPTPSPVSPSDYLPGIFTTPYWVGWPLI